MSVALDYLAKARVQGYKPASVWLLVGDCQQPKFWLDADPLVEIAVKAEGASVRFDWRPLVGCDVMILADTRSEPLRSLVKRLEQIAARITVCIADLLPEQLGHVWERDTGWREWGRMKTDGEV